MVSKQRTRAALLCLIASALLCPNGFAQSPTSVPQPPLRKDVHGDTLPKDALARLGTLRWRHGAAVTFVAHTPDGKGLISDSQDNTLRLWDRTTGVEIRRFVKKATPAADGADAGGFFLLRSGGNGAALSPNGNLLGAGAADGTITVWDVATAKVRHVFTPTTPTPTAALLFSADSELLVSKDAKQVLRVWDLARGIELRTLGKGTEQNFGLPIGALTGAPIFLSGGSVLASASVEIKNGEGHMTVKRWDLVTGNELPPVHVAEGNFDLFGFAFAPDGKTLAVASFQGSLQLYDLATQQAPRELDGLKMMSFASPLAFTPDGKTLAAWSSDQTIRLWDVASGKELRRIGEPSGPRFMGMYFLGSVRASNLAFSADGKELAVGTSGCAIHRWEVHTGKEIGPANGHRADVVALAFAADGKTVATRSADRLVHVWEVSSGKEQRRFALPGDVVRAAFAPDGATLALGSPEGILRLWDMKTGKEIRQWQATANGFADLAFSPDGTVLAARDFGRVVHLWDPATAKELRQIAELRDSETAALRNNVLRSYLASDVSGLFFDAEGATLATMPPADSMLLTRLNGRRTPSQPAALRLWNVGIGKSIRGFEELTSGFAALAYAPDGRTLATAHAGGAVLLWEALTGKVRLQIRSASVSDFTTLAFSPDSRVLAGAGADATICLWNTLTGHEIGKLTGHQGLIHALTFAADGKTLLSASADTTALVWDVDSLLQSHKTSGAAIEDGRIEALWHALGGADPARAHQAAIRLIGAPRQALPVLRERVHPTLVPDAKRVARLLDDIDSRDLAVRRQAADDLEKLGDLVEDALKQALAAQPALERRQRLEQVQARVVAETTLSTEQTQAGRAIEVLERIGTPEAREVLQSLTRGAPGARLTRQAQAALERLGK